MNLRKIVGTTLMGSLLMFSPLKASAQELESGTKNMNGPIMQYHKLKYEDKTVSYELLCNGLMLPHAGSIIIKYNDGRYVAFHDDNNDLIVDTCVLTENFDLSYYFRYNPAHKLVIDKAQKFFEEWVGKILKRVQLEELKKAEF